MTPTEIPARPLSVDEVAEKALAIARQSSYYSNEAIADVLQDRNANVMGWDDFTAEQQVALLNHCVIVVRRTNERMIVNVNVRRP